MNESSYEDENPYALLAQEGPYDVAIGCALITLMEPNPGYDREYNRWYEDEHMPAAFALPWKWAGRRWVATRDLQALRYPKDSPIAQPITTGKYLSVYWITPERYEDHTAWSVAKHKRDRATDRYFLHSQQVTVTFPLYAGVVYRDQHGPRDIHALSYPYQAMVLEVLEPAGGSDALVDWLRDEYLPGRVADSPVAMSLIFVPNPMRARVDAASGKGLERYVSVLSFCEAPAHECWDATFAGAGDAIGASGPGRVVFAGPFKPTLPGTDTYVDQLR